MSKLGRRVLVNGAVYAYMKLRDIVAHIKKLKQNME